ncbi:Chemotaxis response regulator protein-glutamate methylesterase [Pelotomaculum schinkii]|uniref:Protein-glutamate methylesterase/protein-glutamine glutaminase n=1 Tax=Pelotomaculum schinkii TaxID=78350 RepID=A0A4Y7R887_9FIRM|nr:chemotaxis response regulator protein-glutamate methylesterase [Pelotomaculum schinkii]TEB04929.1 Chemotaxis response regulator protein-glutamate methylesterase [Pelotomaculum schinkii]
MKKIKVLVVDDSALVREILARGLAMDRDIEVVGVASDPFIARDKIVRLKPDVLTLDVEMPRMDGVEFLRHLMPQYPLPVIVVSALTRKGAAITLAALEAGAVDVVVKPSTDIARGLDVMLGELRNKVKIAALANVSAWKGSRESIKTIRADSRALAESTDKVIAIGASTGGTEAIRKILQSFTAAIPGVVVVQHMPVGFTKHFADSLNDLCAMEVKEAKTGDRVLPGRVLIAPGDRHMTVRRSGGSYLVDCRSGDKVCGHCPSVEVLFQSVAEFVGANAIGIMLTGMGSDGANGMVAMRRAGARTIAQDETTSVVFGMPKVAYELGGAECLAPLDVIPFTVMNLLAQYKTV